MSNHTRELHSSEAVLLGLLTIKRLERFGQNTPSMLRSARVGSILLRSTGNHRGE
jgi:hypothetical protein